ncbi:MAG TPA: 4'-phosphopantetheinyl transferase superfamily protein, partial [Flavisolibacter sp.]
PIFFQQDIDESTKLAVWKIEEEEDFFLQHVPLQRDITHPHKRLQHLAGRYLLQYLFPDFPINLIKIADTRKPYLEDEAYHFSISHCSSYAAAIVSKGKRVGVDIEVPSLKVEKIMHKFLHEEEEKEFRFKLQAVSGNVEVDNHHDNPQPQTPNPKLTLLWSCKEAVFKWWSYGNVDFSEMIRLQPFDLKGSGVIQAQFLAPQKKIDLLLNYQLWEKLCLAWVAI